MVNNPKLSILIPTYSRCNQLKVTVENFSNQIVKNNLQNKVGIIVSDNASTDGTKELLKKFSNEYGSFFKYNINSKNLGFGGNIIELENLAKGEYIWICGDDDFYNNDLINVILKIADINKPDYVFLNYSDVEINNNELELSNKNLKFIKTKSKLFRTIKTGPGFVSANVFKKDFYNSINTENLVWRHYCKILNCTEKINAIYYSENCIFVNRPKENNWFNPATMFDYVSEIIFEVSKSNLCKNIKNMLLKIYLNNYLTVYIFGIIKDCKYKSHAKIAVENFNKAKEFYNFNLNNEMAILSVYLGKVDLMKQYERCYKCAKFFLGFCPIKGIRKKYRHIVAIYLTALMCRLINKKCVN